MNQSLSRPFNMATEKETEGTGTQSENQELESIPPELLIKHPLQNQWCLWFYKNDRTKAWTENLVEVTSFDAVEDFWALFNHIEVASKLPVGCDYAVFKQGIKPMWEDERNRRGGRWLINLQKQQRTKDLDEYWLELLLCMIGEAFDECSDDICGAVVQVRRNGDKVALWTADVERTEANMKIGKKIKDRLHISPRTPIIYESHEDSQSKTGSVVKFRYQL